MPFNLKNKPNMPQPCSVNDQQCFLFGCLCFFSNVLQFMSKIVVVIWYRMFYIIIIFLYLSLATTIPNS